MIARIARIARIAWTGLIALLALVTVFAQLDRSARFDPALAPLVPQPFRGFAARHMTGQALASGDADSAMAEARNLVRVRPAPAEHMTILAQAATLANDGPLALAALEAASRRGWRDPVAQQAAAEAALITDDGEGAARRVVALLATGSLPEETGILLARLLSSENGRVAFARHLAGTGRWQGNAATRAALVAEPADVAATLALAKAEGASLPCDTLGRIANGYQSGGFEAEAERFWPGDCPTN